MPGRVARGATIFRGRCRSCSWGVLLAWLAITLHGIFGKVLIDLGGEKSPQQVFFGIQYEGAIRARSSSRLKLWPRSFF